ncbi:MAG: RNA polymerase sigma factor [Erysipelotrichaceae bacterium]|nr:RNA polymerase sigma factor [Erysipelotrichaceae bacterium]
MGRVKLRTIKEFRNGNKDAFEDIFYAYKDILYYYSYFFVKDYDDANDCVQEIFIKVVNCIESFNEFKSPFEAWIIITAKSVIYNFIRTKKRYFKRVILDDDFVLSVPDTNNRILEDTLYDLEEMMGREMYIIYILRTGYNVTFDNISKMTNLPRETTRRIYYKSLEIVNNYLGDKGYDKK